MKLTTIEIVTGTALVLAIVLSVWFAIDDLKSNEVWEYDGRSTYHRTIEVDGQEFLLVRSFWGVSALELNKANLTKEKTDAVDRK